MELAQAVKRGVERVQRGEVTGLDGEERRVGGALVAMVGQRQLSANEPGAALNAPEYSRRDELERTAVALLKRVAPDADGASAAQRAANICTVLLAQGVLRRAQTAARTADGTRVQRIGIDADQVVRQTGLGGGFMGPRPLLTLLDTDALDLLLSASDDARL